MCGITPPPAIVALMSWSSSSSPRMANWRWRGVIRLTFKSLDAFPNGKWERRNRFLAFSSERAHTSQFQNFSGKILENGSAEQVRTKEMRWGRQTCRRQQLHRHDLQHGIVLSKTCGYDRLGTGESEKRAKFRVEAYLKTCSGWTGETLLITTAWKVLLVWHVF